MSPQQLKVMRAIEFCRTAALGGHVDQCDTCGHQVISYNSCRNRHCPKCQSLAKARWLDARRAELLPVEYYHVVFTLPDGLAAIALQNKRILYNLLFRAASQTLLTIAADPKQLGAEIGFTAILHTWGQNLMHHPHLHCVVPGGGLAPGRDRWLSCRKGFFLPVRILSRLFRRLFLDLVAQAFENTTLHFHGGLQHLAQPASFHELIEHHRTMEWVVYAKPPFAGPQKVLDYLGRYTHRIAISNHRLVSLHNNTVTFTWKDYQHGGITKNLPLDAHEFIRRFLLHVLPKGFMRIRYYGFLANCHRNESLALGRHLLHLPEPPNPCVSQTQDWAALLESLTGIDPLACPVCNTGRLKRLRPLPISSRSHSRAPPGALPP